MAKTKTSNKNKQIAKLQTITQNIKTPTKTHRSLSQTTKSITKSKQNNKNKQSYKPPKQNQNPKTQCFQCTQIKPKNTKIKNTL